MLNPRVSSRRTFLKQMATAAAAPLLAGAAQADNRPNVLFICVDDLRPQLACYGNETMVTPNLDRLAGQGMLFKRHYVQAPTCGASRCSLLTGLRPNRPELLRNDAFTTLPRTDPGHPISLPGLFRENGYATVSVGKVSHSPNGLRYAKPSGRFDEQGHMLYSGPDDRAHELALSWDAAYGPIGEWGDPWSAFFGYAGGGTRSYVEPKSPAVEAAEAPDAGYPDGITAEAAIHELRRLRDRPFFLSVGFYKPHLPFCAPKKYWDLYDRERIPLAPHPEPPKNADPSLSLHRNGELTGRYAALGDPAHATEAEARKLRHGYFACVSYVDAQIGKVLNELDRLGLRDNTIVVVWGDHGWHLGDLHVWGKHTTFEFSLRSALLIDAPGMPGGANTDALVESLDLYPTLAGLCGLDAPHFLDGTDISPVLEDPAHPGKDGAFGHWRRGKHIATSLRTPRYRLTVWKDPAGRIVQTELYDHKTDPDETTNIAEEQPAVVRELMPQLEARTPELRAG